MCMRLPPLYINKAVYGGSASHWPYMLNDDALFSQGDTWRKYINPEDVEREINDAAPGHLRVVSVSEITRSNLLRVPNGGTICTFLPLKDEELDEAFANGEGHLNYSDSSYLANRDDDPRTHTGVINQESTNINDLGKPEASVKSHTFNDTARKGGKVMCVELVANRFFRKVAAGAAIDTLLQLMNATCRRSSAPPGGLSLVDIGYEDVNWKNFLIK
eukprot:Gb_07553 [translate_table: standard]